MAERYRLRQEYLHRVCRALGEYVERDPGGLHIHSCGCEGHLDVTFTVDDVDLFHALCEGREPSRRPDNPSPAA